MDFSIVPVSKVFKTYQGQARIAELNKKSQVKRVQGQVDRVNISNAARQALQKNPNGDAPVVVKEESVQEPSNRCQPRLNLHSRHIKYFYAGFGFDWASGLLIFPPV